MIFYFRREGRLSRDAWYGDCNVEPPSGRVATPKFACYRVRTEVRFNPGPAPAMTSKDADWPAMHDAPNQAHPDGTGVTGTPLAPGASPLISIIYTTYNQEKFASDALRGVLSQTYPNLDIIILDDVSTDRTEEIIAAELENHKHRKDVRFIRNEANLGAFENTRKGLSLAEGDFIVLFNGDDVMLPNMVERMVHVWRESNVSLVTVNARYIDENGIELNRYFRDPGQPFDQSFETLARDGGNAVCFGAGMGFERDIYVRFGWPPEYLTAEDLLIPFYAYLCKGALFIPEPLMKYRVHAQNTAMTLQWERAKDAVDKLLIEAEDFYVHIAHAVLMLSELHGLASSDPMQFGAISGRIQPLLNEQIVEMAKKLVNARIQLHDKGVTDLGKLLVQLRAAGVTEMDATRRTARPGWLARSKHALMTIFGRRS